MAFSNVYTHRKVAETKAKSCDICYKLSTSVLITPDNKVRFSSARPVPPRLLKFTSRTHIYRLTRALQDWFYVCPAHLKDTGFCTPKIDQAAVEARKKRELEEEIERVKKEYEEKQKKKKEKEAKGDKKDDAEDKNDSKSDKDAPTTQKTEPVSIPESLFDALPSTDSMAQSKDGDAASPAEGEEEPRVFELKRRDCPLSASADPSS